MLLTNAHGSDVVILFIGDGVTLAVDVCIIAVAIAPSTPSKEFATDDKKPVELQSFCFSRLCGLLIFVIGFCVMLG
jgi:hypothetical protein